MHQSRQRHKVYCFNCDQSLVEIGRKCPNCNARLYCHNRKSRNKNRVKNELALKEYKEEKKFLYTDSPDIDSV